MKKHILSLMAAVSLLTGCYDLDRTPYDQVSSEAMWQTADQCKQGLMGVYASLKEDDLFGKMFLIDVNSDVAAGYDQYEVLQLGTATSKTGFYNSKWQDGYNSIQRANLVIRNVAEAPIEEGTKNQILGEAHFLRALVYFHLMDYFGGLPLYDESVDLEKDFNNLMNPRSSVEDTRAFIVKDLEKALECGLPEAWDSENYGRVTLTAVQALLGKVYLYAKEYDKAVEWLEKSTNGHELYSDYAGLFNLDGGHTSSEMIFSIVNLGGTGNNYGMPLCFYAGTRASYGSCWNNTVPSSTLIEMYEYKDGRPFDWDELFPGFTTSNDVKESVFRCTANSSATEIISMPEENRAKILQMYEDRDPRMKATVILPYTTYQGWYSNKKTEMLFVVAKNEKGTITLSSANGFVYNNRGGWETYFWRKYVPEGDWDGAITDRSHTPVNFPIIRLADVYLMLAEAYNEQGNSTKAVEYINKVRERAGIALLNSGPDYLKAVTKDEIFQRIFRERAVEFANEGLRDSDLRRWKLSHTMLNREEYGFTGKRMFTRVFRENRDYLWPIPQDEIDMNSAIKQNPGW